MKQELYVVTGASSGIGEAIARSLFASQAQVLLAGRNKDRLKRLQAELPNSLIFSADLREPQELDALVRFVEEYSEQHDMPLKGLVNNAGIFMRAPFIETSPENWEEQFRTNVFAPMRLTRKLYPLLKKSAPASVLNISSTLGLRAVANTSAYSSAKAALIRWTETIALEWASDSIRVNCICPGLVDTPIHPFYGKSNDIDARKQAHAASPLKRMGRPEDIAQAAVFLLSKQSSWTTGAVWPVDGGIHL